MTLFRTPSAVALAVALLAAGAAQAAPASATVTLGAPRLVRTADGVSLRGSVCRNGPARMAGGLTANLNRPGLAGGPASAQPMALTGDIRGRGPGCAYYDVAVSESDRNLEVCAGAPGAGLSCRRVD